MKKEEKKTADPSFAVKNQGKEQKIITTPLTKKKDKKSVVNIFWHWIQQPYYLSITNK